MEEVLGREENMNLNNEGRRSEKGFTLIELIVVLVILGLLAAVVGPRVYDKLAKGKDQIAKIQIKEFEGALQPILMTPPRFSCCKDWRESP